MKIARFAAGGARVDKENRSRLREHFFAICHHVEFGDSVLLVYIAAFVRPYFWIVSDNTVAWSLTALISGAVWYLYLSGKRNPDERLTLSFWMIVALPLLFIYLIRIPFPDLSYDVLNYRLVHAERGLRGFPFIPGDYFPTIFPLNPAPDIVTGIYRYLLGYRLGTIVNLLAMIWTGTILNKLFRDLIRREWLRYVCVLIVLLAEHMLFEINNYMIDLLALPLLLEATRISLRFDARALNLHGYSYFGILLGGSVAFKLSNIVYVAPILLVCAYKVARSVVADELLPVPGSAGLRDFLSRAACSAVAFAAPSLPHTIWVYRETGSPVFPLYNNIFHSPYWLPFAVFDGRWGPKSLWETVLWSVQGFFHPERLSEIAVYSGRISLAFVVAAICCLSARLDARLRSLCFMFLLGALLWSQSTGYIRYAMFSEVLAGIILVWACCYLLTTRVTSADESRKWRVARRALGLTLALMLVVQAAAAINYVRFNEWSMRPTLFTDFAGYKLQAETLLTDRSITSFSRPEFRRLLDDVEVWVVSDIKINGVEALAKPMIPMIAVNNQAYFETEAGRARLARTLRAVEGRKMFSLSFTENLPSALANLRQASLEAGHITPVKMFFFSPTIYLDLQLIEVSPISSSAINLLDTSLRANIELLDLPTQLRAGQSVTVRVRVKNVSSEIWRAESDDTRRFNLGNHWLDVNNRVNVNDDARSALPADLPPGASIELPLEITPPTQPGDYILEFDMVREYVAWFKERGSQPAVVKVFVAP